MNMSWRLTLGLTLILLVVGGVSSYGQLDNTEDVLGWAQEKAKDASSWKADVDQRVSMGEMEMTVTGSAMAKGAMQRTDFTMNVLEQSVKSIDITDASRVKWSIAEREGQKQITRVDTEQIREAAKEVDPDFDPAMLEGSAMEGRYFDIVGELHDDLNLALTGTDTINGEPVYTLEGKPQVDAQDGLPQGVPERVVLQISQNDAFPRQVSVIMDDGTETVRIQFRNIEIDLELEDTLFSYTPASDEQVLDATDSIIAMLRGEQPGQGSGPAHLAPGQPAPDFEAPALAGGTISLSDYAGKPVLLDFWASWCGPCRAKMPDLIALYQEYAPKGLEVIGISLDNTQEDLEGYLTENPEMVWPQVYDGDGWRNAVANLYAVEAIPHLVLISPDGAIRGTFSVGPALRAAIDDYIDE